MIKMGLLKIKLAMLPNKILPRLIGYRLYPSPIVPINRYYKIYGKNAVNKKNFYNVGAGMFRHKAWTNIDYYSEHYKHNPVDIHHDLTKTIPLPLKDSSANIFYTSHTIEHIDDDSALRLFKEAHRCLRKGGYFRITCPDIQLDYEAYKNKDYAFFKIKRNIRTSLEQGLLISFAGQLSTHYKGKSPKRIEDKTLRQMFKENSMEDFFNNITSLVDLDEQNKHPGNHINWWTHKKLIKLLKKAGFKEVYTSGFGQSRCEVLRDTNYFDNTRPNISLYVEAKK